MKNGIVAKGQRGSWYATIDGTSYPCVHKHWWKKGGTYHDPFIPRGDDKAEYRRAYLEALHTQKRVILSDSGEPPAFAGRKVYIGLYEIDDIDTTNGLRFKFVRRVI
jgi:hypothetical protein